MKAKVCKPKLTVEHQEQFVAMLPTITRVARQAFAGRDPEAKEEAVAEATAAAFIMFVRLVEQGREALAYPSVLGMFGVRRVRIGGQDDRLQDHQGRDPRKQASRYPFGHSRQVSL